jgi:predicted Zn-dependent protease
VSETTRSTARPAIEAVWFHAEAALAPAVGEDIVAAASRHIAVPCRLQPRPWENRPRRLEGREQVDADGLLAALEASAGSGSVHIGLTVLDLGLALFTFVFGRATRNGRAAVVSLARLGPEQYGLAADRNLTVRRAVAEILHELGHVGGLGHCSDVACVMQFASSVERIDLRGLKFCPSCAAALPRQLLFPHSAREERWHAPTTP